MGTARRGAVSATRGFNRGLLADRFSSPSGFGEIGGDRVSPCDF